MCARQAWDTCLINAFIVLVLIFQAGIASDVNDSKSRTAEDRRGVVVAGDPTLVGAEPIFGVALATDLEEPEESVIVAQQPPLNQSQSTAQHRGDRTPARAERTLERARLGRDQTIFGVALRTDLEGEAVESMTIAQQPPPKKASPAPGQPKQGELARAEPAPAMVQPLPALPPRFRLASVPNMFGDTFNHGGQVFAFKTIGVMPHGFSDVPLAGGARRSKIAENNKALPMDRVYVMYNHFHNALDFQADILVPAPAILPPPPDRRLHVDRYTIGLEKTVFCGLGSIELRMPFTNAFEQPESSSTTPQFGVAGGEIGNLTVNLKQLLYEDERTALAVGLGIDTPTGSDATGNLQADRWRMKNEAIHLMPFVGVLRTPNNCLFWHAFAQLDFATQANSVMGDIVNLEVHEQDLLYLDFSVGCWLYRDPCTTLNGLAAVLELHYTTTLEESEIKEDGIFGLFMPITAFQFGNFYNRVDILNLTVGLHAEIGCTELRIGGVFPLRHDGDRMFDAELQVQVNRRF